MYEPVREDTYGLLKVGHARLVSRLRHDDEIEAGGQIVADLAERLANETFSPIALNGTADALANGDAEACPALIVSGDVERDPLVGQSMTLPQHVDEFLARSDTHGTGQGVSRASVGHGRDYTNCPPRLLDGESAAILGPFPERCRRFLKRETHSLALGALIGFR